MVRDLYYIFNEVNVIQCDNELTLPIKKLMDHLNQMNTDNLIC